MEIKIHKTVIGGQKFSFTYRDTRPERGMMKDLIRHKAHIDGWYEYFKEVNFSGDCIDVGANIGICSVIYSKLYSFDTIFAFEPVPWSHYIFLKNILVNKCMNIVPFGKAVSDCGEELGIFYNHSSFASASHFKSGQKGYPRYVKADAMDINKILSFCSKVGLLKIDCEGFELPILEGIKSFRKINGMIVEFHPKLMKRFDFENRFNNIMKEIEKHFTIFHQEDDLKNIMLYALKK